MKKAYLILFFLLISYSLLFSQSGKWVWMNGSNLTNQPGVTGTQGVASPTNEPRGVYGSAFWKDKFGKFWIKGGLAFNDHYDDMWMYDPNPSSATFNQWTWIKGNNLSQGSSWSLPIRNQTLLATGPNIFDPNNSPGTNELTSFNWVDSINGYLWLFAKESQWGGDPIDSLIMWKFDPNPSSPTYTQWAWVGVWSRTANYGVKGVTSALNSPGFMNEQTCTWVDKYNNLWLFMGGSGSFAPDATLWKYDILSNQWTWMAGRGNTGATGPVYGTKGVYAPANMPSSDSYYHSSWTSLNGEELWMYGGTVDEMWKFDININQWAWMGGVGGINVGPTTDSYCVESSISSPGGGIDTRDHIVDKCDRLWRFSGQADLLGGARHNGLWRYNKLTNKWTLINGFLPVNYGVKGVATASNSPSPQMTGAKWIDNSGIWIWGGDGATNGNRLNSMWLYVPDKPTAQFAQTSCSGLNYSFQNNSNPNCDSIVSVLWDFGDPLSGTQNSSNLYNPVHAFSAAGTYNVKLVVSNCFGQKDSIAQTIVISTCGSVCAISSSINKVNDALCNGDNNGVIDVALAGGSGGVYTYSWSNGSTATSSSTYQISNLSSGNYTVTIIDGSCSTTNAVTITEPLAINITFSSITAATCGVSSGSANAIASGGSGPLSYSWSNSTTGQTISNVTAGTYYITVNDVKGCSSSSTVLINNNPAPLINNVITTNVSCNGYNDGSATVIATGTGTLTYSWSNGQSGQTTTNQQQGAYVVSVTDGNGCTTTQSITITEPSFLSLSLFATDATCNQNNGSVIATVAGGSGQYTYNWSNGITSTTAGLTSQIANLSPQVYSVTITDSKGCTTTATTSIAATTIIPATASATETLLTEGTATQLTATGGSTYLWSPSDFLNFSNIQNPIATPNVTTTYTVIVTDNNNCKDTAEVTINVLKGCTNEEDVFVANVFSPNNDGKNDILYVQGNGLSNLYWAIYDRWGNLLFESNTQNNGWNGTYKNKAVDIGTYVYYLKGICKKNMQEVILKGNVSVVK